MSQKAAMHRDRRPTWGGGWAARAVGLSLGLVVAAAAQCGSPPQYTTQIIQHPCGPPFPPALTVGTGLSSRGEVCGYHWPCDGPIEQIGFVWTAETGIVPIPVPPGVVVVTPADINDKGQLTGQLRLTSGYERGFLLSDGEWTLIEPLCPDGHSDGRALNAEGAITGVRSAPICVGVFWGYVYDRGVITDIVPTVRERYADSVTQDISLNQVVGWQGQSGSEGQPFAWSRGSFTDLQVPMGATGSVPKAVTDCSVVVGLATQPSVPWPIGSALRWEHALPEQLPALPGHVSAFAYDLSSEQDAIVGASSDGTTIGYGRAVLWRDGDVYDLNASVDSLGIQLVSASDISSTGQILCSAVNPSGHLFAVLLTPRDALGDLNGDGTVGGLDLAVLLAAWGVCSHPCDCSMDFDHNDIVNGFDLAILLANWS